MSAIDKDIQELQARLGEGSIQRAYRGIISYMSRVQKALAEQHGEGSVSGVYQGHLDITHFALFPDPLKARGLKLTILFNYETFSFDIWLTARNRKIQKHYWQLLAKAGYAEHSLLEPEVCNVAIVKAILVKKYSLESESSLTAEIVGNVNAFERNILAFLNKVDTGQKNKAQQGSGDNG